MRNITKSHIFYIKIISKDVHISLNIMNIHWDSAVLSNGPDNYAQDRINHVTYRHRADFRRTHDRIDHVTYRDGQTSGGQRTESITWKTPFDTDWSATITLAWFIFTPSTKIKRSKSVQYILDLMLFNLVYLHVWN